MKKKLNLLSTIFVLLIFSSFATATVTLPLNSGYDHWNGNPYATGSQDNYWINVSTPGNFIPSWAIAKHPSWAPPLPNSQWVNYQSSWSGAPGTTIDNPTFSIYRKCFCLQQGYTLPNMTFNLSADDNSAVFFNSSTNILLVPAPGNPNGPPRPVSTTTGIGFSTIPGMGFKVGTNCLYVFVENTGPPGIQNDTGFNLAGTMTVGAGMLSMPASGPNQSYAPCSCRPPIPVKDSSIKDETKRSILAAEEDDTEVIKGILKFAEERRLQRIKDAPKQK